MHSWRSDSRRKAWSIKNVNGRAINGPGVLLDSHHRLNLFEIPIQNKEKNPRFLKRFTVCMCKQSGLSNFQMHVVFKRKTSERGRS